MISNFLQGLKNLKLFFKVVWRFRWFDERYLYNLMIVAMKEMEKGQRSKYARCVNSEKRAKNIQIARKSLERINDDNYYEEELIPFVRAYLNDIHLGVSLSKYEDRERRLRIYKRQDRARREDWERFLKLFRQSEMWWD